MQGAPRQASDDGLLQLLWKFLSQVGLGGGGGGGPGRNERCSEAQLMVAERWEKGEVQVGEVPECCRAG